MFFGASGAAIWLVVLGAWLATGLGTTDGLAGLQLVGSTVAPHLGDVAAALSALAVLATMGMNAYGGMLTVLTGVDSFRPITPTHRARVTGVLALAVVWFVVGRLITASAVDTVFTALTLMPYLLVPWTAVNLVDFFVVRRGHYAITELFRPDGIYGAWAWRGLGAYAVGLAVEVPFMVLPDLAGASFTALLAAALGGVDVAWLVGLAVTSVVYLLLGRSLDLGVERGVGVSSNQALGRPAPGTRA